MRVANGRNLEARALEWFLIERERIDTLRQVRAEQAPTEFRRNRRVGRYGYALKS